MWGQKSFDHSRFPDPSNMIQTLHDEDVHFYDFNFGRIWIQSVKITKENEKKKKFVASIFRYL